MRNYGPTMAIKYKYRRFLLKNMNDFERKYKIKDDRKAKEFHKKRRMFCIKDSKLFVAKTNLPYSHAVWFEKEGWFKDDDDSLIDKIVRGFVNEKGDVYFYMGYDFQITETIEKELFKHIGQLVEKLNLKQSARVFGGLNEQESAGQWSPKKDLGRIADILRHSR